MKESLLSKVNNPEDLRLLKLQQLNDLVDELRQFIINIVATKEGHLGASLGVVELTVALHYVFETPRDLLIWDVGHQAYGHKILTGRRSRFHTNRQFKGISGFPKRSESKFDAFGVGHSSTSISAILGMAIASHINGQDKHHIAVIGDASIASGMAFEGLNHAGVTNANILIILNDNAIGIDPSVGALKEYLTNVKSNPQYQDNIFEALKFDYSGPIDGHDLELLISELERLKKIDGPKLLHVVTTKGKGLDLAEKDQVTYHAPGRFDVETGIIKKDNSPQLTTKFQDVFGKTIVELAGNNEKIIGITPAMPTGSSLKLMMERFPKRAFDVGIAEQHAVTLAAGMAAEGLIPFCNIYSTFLQRAYDQIIHDVALQKLPVIFCLDRAGLVGQDGATHHGVFDISFLRCIPNLIIATPSDEIALRNILYTAQLGLDLPIAIRYPRGRGDLHDWEQPFERVTLGSIDQLCEGEDIAVVSFGTMKNTVHKALDNYPNAKRCSHYSFEFVWPLDEQILHEICQNHKAILTIEDGAIKGGAGSSLLEFMAQHQYHLAFKQLGVPHEFIDHGSMAELQELVGLDVDTVRYQLEQLLQFVQGR